MRFMLTSSVAPIIPFVPASSGTVTTTTSDAASSSWSSRFPPDPVEPDAVRKRGCRVAPNSPDLHAQRSRRRGPPRRRWNPGPPAPASGRQEWDGKARRRPWRWCATFLAGRALGGGHVARQHQGDHQDVLRDGPCVVEGVGHQGRGRQPGEANLVVAGAGDVDQPHPGGRLGLHGAEGGTDDDVGARQRVKPVFRSPSRRHVPVVSAAVGHFNWSEKRLMMGSVTTILRDSMADEPAPAVTTGGFGARTTGGAASYSRCHPGS